MGECVHSGRRALNRYGLKGSHSLSSLAYVTVQFPNLAVEGSSDSHPLLSAADIPAPYTHSFFWPLRRVVLAGREHHRLLAVRLLAFP